MEVEQITGVLGDPSSWQIHKEEGELVIVKNPSGVGWIKLAKSEAIRLGLWKEERGTKGEERKAQEPRANKQRRPGANKGGRGDRAPTAGEP